MDQDRLDENVGERSGPFVPRTCANRFEMMKLCEYVSEGDHVEWCCASDEKRNSHCPDQIRPRCACGKGSDGFVVFRVLVIVSLFEVDGDIVVQERLSDREEEFVDQAYLGKGMEAVFRGMTRNVIEDMDKYFGG